MKPKVNYLEIGSRSSFEVRIPVIVRQNLVTFDSAYIFIPRPQPHEIEL